MKNAKYIIIGLMAIAVVGLIIPSPAKAQSLEGIDLPALPQITKPISEMTIPELQAKITEIMTVIKQLQAILVQLTGQEIPSNYSFATNLKYGTSSNDVKYLQIMLNQDSETRVSDTGWGSPGNESMYFGEKTLRAVIKFQEKHSIPNTGYVGPITRTKLNEFLQQAPSIPTTPTTPTIKGICGDSIIQTPNEQGIHEVCDNANLGTNTCLSRGYAGGTLSCSSDCLTFNTNNCITTTGGGGGGGETTPAPSQPVVPVCGNNTDNICPSGCSYNQDTDCTYCGDNILQTPNSEGVLEVCDTNVLNNQTCITKGFPGGTLKCSNTCLTFDTSSCTPPPPLNQAPVLTLIGNKSVRENQQLSFTVSATDPDGDTLTYSVQNNPSGASFNSSTKTFNWTPSYTQSGTYTITFTVSDSNLTDTETMTITVNNVNRPPILNDIGNKTIAQNNVLTFTISGTDPDGDTLTYSAQNLPSGASFNSSTKTFTWTPSTTGTFNTTFTISDGALTDTETITITVSSLPPINNPPVSSNQSLSLNEDNTATITLSAADPNGDALTYSVVSQPSRGTLTGTPPNLTYTPNTNYNGPDSFTFKANDGKIDSNTATISLTINSVNDAPVLAAIGNKSVNENSVLTFQVTATDIDSSTLTYSIQNSPSGASFNTATRTFSWTPSYTQAGTYNITFIVSDGELTDSETITITVNNVPESTPQDCKTSTSSFQNFSITQQRGTFTVEYDATPNNSSMDGLMMLSNSAGSTYDNYAVLVRFTTNNYIEVRNGATYGRDLNIAYTPGTSYHFKIEVDVVNHKYDVYVNNQLLANDYAFRTTQNTITSINYYGIIAETGSLKLCNFQITSSTPPANRPPVLNPIGNKSVVVNNALTFTISATDPDGDTLTYSAQNLPAGATFNASIRTFSWTPTTIGTYSNITLIVSDGELTDSETIVITVSTVPTYPTTNKISQFGITWTFDKEYEYGQFANGDYWVVGPVTITEITPASTYINGRAKNGAMINPNPSYSTSGGQWIGYDNGANSATTVYTAELNVARPGGTDLSASNPLVVPVGSSLISTKSFDTPGLSVQLSDAAILTVLSSPASAGDFRPSYSGTDKTIKFNKNEINYSILQNLELVGSTPTLSSVERKFERPWLDHKGDWRFTRFMPANNMSQGTGYGREIATDVGIGALMLHIKLDDNPNVSNAMKETLLIRYVQLGIDLYGAAKNGMSWTAAGGIFQGRKWPILFAGLALNSNDFDAIAMRAIGTNPLPGLYFHEDDQTFYVAQSDINMTHNPDMRNCNHKMEYEQSDLGLPDWGARHRSHPVEDHKAWESRLCPMYRMCCTANSFAGFVLAAHIMDVKDLWNHDALFDYMDRYMSVVTSGFDRQQSAFAANMWDTYRAGYGCVWTAFNQSDMYSNGACQGGPQQCLSTDTSCGTYPNCQNCNSLDACSGTSYRDYRCSGTSCVYTEYPNDSRCAPAPECTSGQTRSCNTGLQGICSSGTQTCQSNGTWGTCVQNNQPVAEICNDSLDNDCDGTTDCSDSDCSSDPACQTPTPTIPTDYISYWKFEGNAQDEKGVNNGTIYGNPQFVAGAQGQALSFDGSGDYVDVGDVDVIGDITVSLWANSPIKIAYQSPVSEYAWDSGWYIREDGVHPGHWQFYVAGRGTATDPASIVRNQWVHLVGINNGTNILLYKDGVLVKSAASSGATQSTWQNLFIGTTASNYFNGLIDNVMVYNRALSASEIQNIYNSQKIAMRVEPGQDELFLKNLASILSAIQEILEKLKSLF